MFSVAVGPDSNAHAGCAEADTAAVFVAPMLNVALARSISVIVAPVADHNMAFTTFAPAAAVFIANHANVLNSLSGATDTSAESGAAKAAVTRSVLAAASGSSQ